jgi:hypothetical protein
MPAASRSAQIIRRRAERVGPSWRYCAARRREITAMPRKVDGIVRDRSARQVRRRILWRDIAVVEILGAAMNSLRQ